MAKSGDTPRIYVADLAAYNAGRLHGAWIDADQDLEDIQAEIQKILAASPEPGAEEWAIHDYENFGSLRLSESEDLATVSRAAKLIGEHGAVLAAVIDHLGGLRELDEAERAFEENYQGSFRNTADWAEELANDTGAPLENYRSYIDWESVARDAELNGDIFTVETDDGIHVFWSR